MLCGRRINVKIEILVCKTVVRPSTMYGAETWPVKKMQEKKLDGAEIKMLR